MYTWHKGLPPGFGWYLVVIYPPGWQDMKPKDVEFLLKIAGVQKALYSDSKWIMNNEDVTARVIKWGFLPTI